MGRKIVDLITRETKIQMSARVAQMAGLFDLENTKSATEKWDLAELKTHIREQPWSIGLIVGPSGCGKSTIARELFPEHENLRIFPDTQSIIDDFPEGMPIKEIAEHLSSVGFSSPPAWLKPYNILSTGQKFRADMALALASADPGTPVLVDEFTSVVDRTVAKIGSAAIARTVRNKKLTFVAATCHEDVEDWLQPDWVYRPAEKTLTRRLLRHHPPIELEIFRASPKAWPLFAPHHYLSHDLSKTAQCFLATWNEIPVAFSAWIHVFGKPPPCKREHRTVCLPDYQGVGIGARLTATIASMYRGLGYRASSTTTHPGVIAYRKNSRDWTMVRPPGLCPSKGDVMKHATTRLTAGFQYIGPKMPTLLAQALLG